MKDYQDNAQTQTKTNILAYLVLGLCLISSSFSAEFNCNFNSAGDSDFNEHLVTKGTEELLCIHFLPYYVKFSFRVGVDSFAAVSGKHLYDLFQDEVFDVDDIDIVLQISGSSEISQQIPYIRNMDKLTFPLISIMIHTDEGKITHIEVEDLKEACPENNIVPEVLPMGLSITSANKIPFCGQEFCEEDENESGLCDLKVFVTWEGTDKKGNLMVSSSNRLKQFARNNLKAMYGTVKHMSNNFTKETDNIYDYEKIPEDVRNRLQTKNTEF
jgi:hypothetical protein